MSFENYDNSTTNVDFRNVFNKMKNEMYENFAKELCKILQAKGLQATYISTYDIWINGIPMEIVDHYEIQFNTTAIYIDDTPIDSKIQEILRKNHVDAHSNRRYRFADDLYEFFKESTLLAYTNSKLKNMNQKTGVLD